MAYNPLNLDPSSREPLKSSLEKLDTMAEELYGILPAGVDLTAYGANIVPSTDDTYNLGSPTKRWASVYVGPNSLHIGDVTVSATTDGNLLIPGVTDPALYQALEVVADGNTQQDVWQNAPVVIDRMTFLAYSDPLNYPVPLGWVPAVYVAQINGSGFISTISVLTGGNDYNDTDLNGVQDVATICSGSMYAAVAGTTFGPGGITVADWNEIPFYVVSGGVGVKLTDTISADFEPEWNNITGKPTFAAVATSGDYDDLDNLPTIPVDVSDLTDTGGLLDQVVDLTDVTGPIIFTDGFNNDTTRVYADGYDVAIPNTLTQQLTFESDVAGTLTDGIKLVSVIDDVSNNNAVNLEITDVNHAIPAIQLVGGEDGSPAIRTSLSLGGIADGNLYRWANAYVSAADVLNLTVTTEIKNGNGDTLINPVTKRFTGDFEGNGSLLTDIPYSSIVNKPTGTFSTIAVSGQNDVVADAINDTLTFVAGPGISISTSELGDAITITNTGSGGGSGLSTRGNLTETTTSIADGASEDIAINAFKSYVLLKVETDAAAWVRIYTDAASRTADASRTEGEDPEPDAGVIAEVITTSAETILMAPGVIGFNNDSPVSNTVYLAVTNKSGTTRSIAVTLTVLQLES